MTNATNAAKDLINNTLRNFAFFARQNISREGRHDSKGSNKK